MAECLIDFTLPIQEIAIYTDASERKAGMSHGVLSFQNGIKQNKHYFFAHLQPQPNGAGFVSAKISKQCSFADKKTLTLHVKNLTEKESHYQLVLDTSDSIAQDYSYVHDFTLTAQFEGTKDIVIENFYPVKRGTKLTDKPKLNTNDIQRVGIRIVGRASLQQDQFQSGIFALAISRIDIA